MYTGPKIVRDNSLVLYYDDKNIKSYTGRPTTNIGINTYYSYNNVSGNVTSTLVATNEFYNGSIVYKQTLTPLDATGVSYLTNANNPGIGIYINSIGGGLANRYTGHSIFFKPMAQLFSTPIFTAYSNIAGWQSTNQYDILSDGWYRAKVIWYDTVTRTDNKYWAINPLYATIGVPIIIYWAGSFKEDLNSSYLSQYTTGTRSVTQGLVPLNQTKILPDLTAMTYDSNSNLFWNGTSSYVDCGNDTSLQLGSAITISAWVKLDSTGSGDGGNIVSKNVNSGFRFRVGPDYKLWWYVSGNLVTGGMVTPNTWIYLTVVGSGAGLKAYIDGILVASNTTPYAPTSPASGNFYIGTNGGGEYFNGKIGSVKVFNRVLSPSEILSDFKVTRVNYETVYWFAIATLYHRSGKQYEMITGTYPFVVGDRYRSDVGTYTLYSKIDSGSVVVGSLPTPNANNFRELYTNKTNYYKNRGTVKDVKVTRRNGVYSFEVIGLVEKYKTKGWYITKVLPYLP
jgi:hypothetical protein